MSKKIIQIKKGEYLLEIMTAKGVVTSVKTTYNKDSALDVSKMSLDQVGYLVDNFKRVGYTKVKIETIEVEAVKESTFETANKIDKALKEFEGASDEV